MKKSSFPRKKLADGAVDTHPGQKQTFGITNNSITNNVPVVYMVRYVVVLRGDFRGGGLKIETFLGPEMATSVASAI